jgi:uncharacterized membrane protein
VTRVLVLLHLLGLALTLGGLVCQLVLLERYKRAAAAQDRIGSEHMAGAVIALVQAPGVWLAIASGILLLWRAAWAPLPQGWFHFKLLFVFWVALATRLLGRNAGEMHKLREQCGADDSSRLRSLKDNHAMIGYVTLLVFVFILTFSLWRPF